MSFKVYTSDPYMEITKARHPLKSASLMKFLDSHLASLTGG